MKGKKDNKKSREEPGLLNRLAQLQQRITELEKRFLPDP